MAHFLEHLVFKGGEKYDSYREVNETAERLGGVLNAYTSHDLVAFHITVRAESAPQAIDLLIDFVGRPRLDARGARPRARRGDPGDQPRLRPALDRGRVPDRPGRVRRAPARAHRAGPGGEPAHLHARGRSSRSASAAGRARAAGRSWRATSTDLPDEARADRALRPLPRAGGARALRARAGVRAADAGRAARHQPVAPAHDLPPRRSRSPTCANAPRCRSTRRCSAARWARGCSRRSARSAACATRSTRSTTRSPTCRSCSSARAWSRRSASRRTRACARSWTSCATDGPTEEEVARARAYAAGRLVLAFENTGAVARYAAGRAIVFGEDIDPDAAIAALDAVTFDEVREVAAGVADNLAVACVGPHTARNSERQASDGVRASSARAQPIATMRSIGTRAALGDLRRARAPRTSSPAARRAAWAA